MIELPGVTLACVDTLNPGLALRALARSRGGIRFARTLFFTDTRPGSVSVPPGIDSIAIEKLASRDDYSRFVLKKLLRHIDTPHVLLAQWDGYVVHAPSWDPAFADVDYLGAKWFWHDDGHDVGNGGFSLRSRRLLEALQDPRIELVDAEDTTIGRTFRTLLERDHGIRFGTAALADRFAFEAAYPIGRPFGFHGLFNFCRVMPPDELAALAEAFSDATLRSPQLAQLLRNCVALGQWQPAIAIARRMLSLDPGHAEATTLLAQSEDALARGAGIGRNDPCPCGSGRRYKQCHGAVSSQPPTPVTLVAHALAAHRRGDLAQASADYRAALAIAPDHPHAVHYLGVIDYQQGQPSKALPLLDRAVALLPEEPEFHNNLGLVLAALDRNADAAAAHRQAIARKPDHAGAWNNLGLALNAQMDLAGAIDAFRTALVHGPDAVQTHWNLALALLADGRFDEGWRAYEARLAIPAFAPSATPPTPRWNGANASGMAILLVTEQGLGDAIQFVRLAKILADRGARVIVQCPAPLKRLLTRVVGVNEVVAHGDALPPHDAWLPLLSLPGILGIDAANIPGVVPYLQPDPTVVRSVAPSLAPVAGKKRVGIAWTGNRLNTNDRRRSVPLATLRPLLDLAGVAWFSLQHGDDADPDNRPEDLDALLRLPARDDFEGLAAMIAQLDLVVTVDTSVAHLAGALARPVFVLLPFMSDWRWRAGRDDSDWYPTAQLFRQSAPGDWPGVVAAVRSAVAGFGA